MADMKVVGVGAPAESTKSDTTDLGSHFTDAEPFSDIRQVVAKGDADVLLIMTAAHAEPGADVGLGDDLEFLNHCKHHNLRVFSTAPAPSTTRSDVPHDAVRTLGLLRNTPIWLRATDALANFGPVQTVSVSSRCARDASSLGARLFDAMTLVHALLGLPESVDAALVTHPTPSAGQGPPRTLRRLRGDITANLRFGAHRAGALTLSDRGGRWFRGVTLLGDAGCFRLDEKGFEHLDPDGALVDASEPTDAPGTGESGAHAVATDLRRALDPHLPAPEPMDVRSVLAMCEAAILSASTGAAEPPSTILQMARADRV
jgi:hypothetical protein